MIKKQGLYDPAFEHDACGVGFIAKIDGEKSHNIVKSGVQILCNLEHRGAVGGDMKTGDGAGMLIQMPHKFFNKVTTFNLPQDGEYGAGMLFLPVDVKRAKKAVLLTEKILKQEGVKLLGWRDVPVNADCLGEQALAVMPSFKQLFVSLDGFSGDELERKLYILRKVLENAATAEGFPQEEYYFPSFSSKTFIYKGMFVSAQFETFYPDITDPDFESAIALVHQRYSTNTMPTWPLAQPFRYIAHNGEINTLRRNVNNMTAREATIESPLFGDELKRMYPIACAKGSDSAAFDNVYELLNQGGRTLEHSIMMMIPEAFGTKYHISEDKRSFYEYHSAIMEPWDGPAAMAFTDGTKIGATLDRSGLRPARYTITKDGHIVLGSETGIIDIKPNNVLSKGRLAPGGMIVVDTEKKRVLRDREVKSIVSRKKPYRRWLEQNSIHLKGLLGTSGKIKVDADTLALRLRTFGYTMEDIQTIVTNMAVNSQEPIGSMGNDSALAVLSDKPQLLFNYFRQLFAQVTNPPIDPYRENLVMSLMSFVGNEKNLLDETPEHCKQLKLKHPILTNDDIRRLRNTQNEDLNTATVSMLFNLEDGKGSLKLAVDKLCKNVETEVDKGNTFIILSDIGTSEKLAPIPSLLATSAVHHYLVRVGKRHLAGLIIESGEVREVHHFATLIGYGASAINPHLVFEALPDLKERGYIPEDITIPQAVENYVNAAKKGILKVMSKMGISTLRSYRGAQIYEAVGLSTDLIESYFTGTPSKISGIGLEAIEKESVERHNTAYSKVDKNTGRLESGGKYSYRKFQDKHLFTPTAVVNLQKSVREGNYETFKKYSNEVNNVSENLCTLRGLLKFKDSKSIDINKVEPATEIVKRFVSSAMSFGSISKEAHECMAIAMNRIGGMSNSGEGGEDESRYTPLENGDSARSKVKQVASGRFGVTSTYLVNADEIQIKMAQGAKPGEGGQLPGHKVNDVIAKVRHSTPGVMLISPPPHHDIYSIEDLSQLIFDLKNANPTGRVSVKLVSEVGVGTVAAGVAKGKADMVLISGSDGGTGASPLSSLKYAGSFWEIGLAETQQTLVLNKLRNKIRIQVDGQIKTGRDVVIGALLGAEEFGFGTTTLVTMGCIIMRKCHTNSCPVGIATQREDLRKRFSGKVESIINFMMFIAEEVREIMAELGIEKFDDLVGQVDRLEVNEAVDHFKSEGLDFAPILYKPEVPEGSALRCTSKQVHDFSLSLDDKLIAGAKDALENGKPVIIQQDIRNCNRTVGTTLSSEVARIYGSAGLPDDTIKVKLDGVGGQSLGAFLSKGITFEIEGETNDFLGKGLSGGKIIIYPPADISFTTRRNIIAGNVALFGATTGEAYINGMAGERFAVRNSGALAVVEGVGDHGCEYMTGGTVVVLGKTGVNFAAGMSGGVAYIFDENQLFDTYCNLEMVDIEAVDSDEDKEFLLNTIKKHIEYTDSTIAKDLLNSWDESLPLFVKVMPLDYRRALEKIKASEMSESENPTITEEVYN
ncbi:MAG: glutamate synthase large subunit [Spirochaetaceae bacterium]